MANRYSNPRDPTNTLAGTHTPIAAGAGQKAEPAIHAGSAIPPLRPNYTAADFEAGQSVVLRCDGATGVPRYMDGSRASVVKAAPRRLRVRLWGRGSADGDERELSVTPNQVDLILAEVVRAAPRPRWAEPRLVDGGGHARED